MISKNLVMYLLAIISITSSIALYFLGDCIMNLVISSLLVLTPNSKLYFLWRDIPIPTYLDAYLFNWTNPTDINNRSVKPKLDVVGPYRFWETREKINITWNENNTVTYRQLRYYYYDEDNENGNLSDTVTILNGINAYLVHMSQDWGYVFNQAMSSVFDILTRDVPITATVDALLSTGIDEPFIEIAPIVSFITGMPNLPFDKIALYYIRNGSQSFDGVFNMATDASNNMGELLNWNYGKQTLPSPGECWRARGSAGEIYPRPIKRDSIGFFVTEFCRYVQLDYEKDVVVNGVTGYKYTAGDSLLDNGTVIPGNDCYCDGDCLPSGMINVSRCRYGVPLFASLPHFYKSDPVYVDAVEGLRPVKDEHEFYLVIEPTLGIPLEVRGRVQFNYLLHPVEYVRAFKEVPRIFFPLVWLEVGATLPEEWASLIRTVLNIPYMAKIAAAVFGVLGIALLLYVYYQRASTHKMKHYNEQPIPPYKKHLPHVPSEQEPCINITKSTN